MSPWDAIGWMIAIILGLIIATVGGAFISGVIVAIRGKRPASRPPPGDVPYWAALSKAVVAHRLGITAEEVNEMSVFEFQATLAVMLKELETQKGSAE